MELRGGMCPQERSILNFLRFTSFHYSDFQLQVPQLDLFQYLGSQRGGHTQESRLQELGPKTRLLPPREMCLIHPPECHKRNKQCKKQESKWEQWKSLSFSLLISHHNVSQNATSRATCPAPTRNSTSRATCPALLWLREGQSSILSETGDSGKFVEGHHNKP